MKILDHHLPLNGLKIGLVFGLLLIYYIIYSINVLVNEEERRKMTLNLSYTRNSLQREARASECSLQRAREGTPPYPTCCYARHMMRAVNDVM